VPLCRACKQLIEDNRLLCPHCYAPQSNTASAAHRPRAVIAVVIVLAVIALAVRLLVYRLL
jgi:hypothetical protein